MNNAERLLSLEHHRLEVWKFDKEVGGGIGVAYKGADVEDGIFLRGEFGSGNTFEEACDDYLKKISGKTLVFGCGESRQKVTVL